MKFKKDDRVYHQLEGHGTILYPVSIRIGNPDDYPPKYARDGEEGYLVDFDNGHQGKILYVDIFPSTRCCPNPILSLTNTIDIPIYTCSTCLKQS